ncbi:universal stress protein [Fusobacterium perfoetens]|uniref:universal stress protein n=1 Tax=Fusobacterium perfoetens TaxID=852 RepID=UPI001F242B66|nr:universal stress protein [Fusobacterium perfoetens]MCF2625396.1 universal stress protein [Fusobacterium perfoetens]
MKKILIPLDGTERSMHSIDLVKNLYNKDEVEITLLYIKEDVKNMIMEEDLIAAEKDMQRMTAPAVKELMGYKLTCEFGLIDPGSEIVKRAIMNSIDIIIMTKSTKKGLTRMIGSVTSYVVRNAPCIVMIVPE